ncbi:MAG: DUF3014 domain-containing protein [Porticoccaceae bacterium]
MAVRKSSTGKFVLALGSSAVLAFILWAVYQTRDISQQSELEIMGIIPQQPVQQATIEEPPIPSAEIPSEPSSPAEVSESTPAISQPDPPSLPTLDASDDFFRDQLLSETPDTGLKLWLQADDLIRRSASYIDGMARGSLLGKVFPLSSPDGKFTTHKNGDQIWLNAGNYERYNKTIDILMSVDMQQVAGLFHRIRPLLESAFAELGYRPRQMDGLILQSLDNILATPVIVEPLQLVRESVAYQFADPELEALLPIQKQLLRAGPENTRRLQKQALALKNALLNP